MRVISAVLAAALLAVATTAWAQADQAKPVDKPEASPASRVTTASAKDDPDVVVCINHPQLGSRIPGKKECRTRRDWDRITDDSRRALERLQGMTMQHVQ
jgi:hypothetical protein